jgi:Tat protein secretion system quality control protein TatD with DNase activity
MQFLSIREFSKAPKVALSKLASDGKAVLTNNGKPAAIMITVNPESFERVFNLVQEVEKHPPVTGIHPSAANDKERAEAFERLMKFKREKAPSGFNNKKELMEAIDERFGSFD